MESTMALKASVYIRCTALYISGTWARTGATSCVHKPGRSRSALYTRCTIPKTHTPVQQAMGSTLAGTAINLHAVRLCTAPGPVNR